MGTNAPEIIFYERVHHSLFLFIKQLCKYLYYSGVPDIYGSANTCHFFALFLFAALLYFVLSCFIAQCLYFVALFVCTMVFCICSRVRKCLWADEVDEAFVDGDDGSSGGSAQLDELE